MRRGARRSTPADRDMGRAATAASPFVRLLLALAAALLAASGARAQDDGARVYLPTPVGAQASDSQCLSFTLDNTGLQKVTGSSSGSPSTVVTDRPATRPSSCRSRDDA